MNVLDKVNKYPYKSFLDMTPHYAYIIPIHVHTITIAGISHEKRSEIPLSNKHNISSNKTMIKLC